MSHPILGDTSASMTVEQKKACGKAIAAFMRACDGQAPEVAVYALAILAGAMAKPFEKAGGMVAGKVALRELLDEINSIASLPDR